MGRANKDVGGYRGRRTITDILRFIAIALAVVVVLVLAGVFYLQKYLVYTDDGPRLNLPPILQIFRREGTPAENPSPLPDPGDISVVIDPEGGNPSGSEPPQWQAEGPWGPGYALELPVEDLVSGAAAAKLEEAGASALILEVKGADGKLAWSTQNHTANWAEVSGDMAVNTALEGRAEEYTIARVCCFRDDSVPYSWNKLALRKGNYNWRDELGLRWLSPAQKDAQDYIAALCGELGDLGVDEIVLEQWHFPIEGNVENITQGEKYDPNRFTASLEEFLTKLGGATGAKISLRVSRNTLSGAESVSGVTPELLERYAYRVWVEEDGLLPAPQDLLRQAGIADEDERRPRLVSVVPVRDEAGPAVQAVIPVE